MFLFMFVILGLAVGVLARVLVPGAREPGRWFAAMLIAMGGSLLGGFIGREVGRFLPIGEDPSLPAGYLTSLVAAIALVAIYFMLAKPRRDEKPLTRLPRERRRDVRNHALRTSERQPLASREIGPTGPADLSGREDMGLQARPRYAVRIRR